MELELKDNKLQRVVDILLAAENDWPEAILSIEDYLIELKKHMKGFPLSKQNLNDLYYNLDSCDLPHFAWRVESASNLRDLYTYYNEELLVDEIINDIKIKLSGIVD